MPSPRRLFRLLPSVLVLLATVALLLVGCGGDGDEATDGDAAGTTGGSESAEPVTLSVGLFGTFGYKEAGLYDEYMELKTVTPRLYLLTKLIMELGRNPPPKMKPVP